MLPRHTRCVLSRLRHNEYSFLLSFHFFMIGIIKNLSGSACEHSSQDTFPLLLHCPATTLCAAHSLATLCLSTTSGPGSEELPGFWNFMVFRHAPIPWKGSANNNNDKPIKRSHKRIGGHGMQDFTEYKS